MNFVDNIQDDEIDFLLERVKKGKILKLKEKIEINYNHSFYSKVYTKFFKKKQINYLQDSVMNQYSKSDLQREKEILEKEKFKKYIISSLENCDDFTIESIGDYSEEHFIISTYNYEEEPDDIFLERIKADRTFLLSEERKRVKQLLKESTRNVLVEKNKNKKRGRPKKKY